MGPRPFLPRQRSLPVIAEERESMPPPPNRRRSAGRTDSIPSFLAAGSQAPLVFTPPHERYSRSLFDDVSSPPPPPLPANVKDLSNLNPVDHKRVHQLRECLQRNRPRRRPPTRSRSTSSLLSSTTRRTASSSATPREVTPFHYRQRPMYPSTDTVESLDLEPVVLLEDTEFEIRQHSKAQTVSPTRSSSAVMNASTTPSSYSTSRPNAAPVGLLDDSTSTDHSNSTTATYESLEVAEPSTVTEATLASYTQISSTYFEERNHDPVYLEIEPGRKERLRGTAEMIRALQLGFVRSTCCLACQCRILCIANVAWVVCPNCRSISPTHAPECRPGVGLGMKL